MTRPTPRPSGAASPSPLLIVCPVCGAQSDRIKEYRFPTFVLFLVVAYAFRREQYTACAPCMRRRLWRGLAINLPTANLLWPILILPWYGSLLVATVTKGHSKAVPVRHDPRLQEMFERSLAKIRSERAQGT